MVNSLHVAKKRKKSGNSLLRQVRLDSLLVPDSTELETPAVLRLRGELPKLYSQDLLNNLFRHPYTKIEFIERDLGVSRPTATKYLATLEKSGLLRKTKLGRTNFYINEPLFNLLSR